jgi:MFS family permease
MDIGREAHKVCSESAGGFYNGSPLAGARGTDIRAHRDGFQFQSVAALSLSLVADFHLSYAALGTLVGLYLFPGVVVALPGGVIAERFGDKKVVCAGLAAMALGSALMALAEMTSMLNIGRIISGSGAVFLNVLVTKMVTDWFEGKEIVTALGILITTWPLGIALGLIAVPPLAIASSWQACGALRSQAH